METVILEPKLSYAAAKKEWLNKPLYGFQPKYMPTVDTFYQTPDGEAKLLFLKDVLDANVYDKCLPTLQEINYTPAKNSRRACLKGSPGGDALFGYTDNLVYLPQKNRKQESPELTAPSIHQWKRYRRLWPIVWKMEDALRDRFKDYWQGREIGDERGPMYRPRESRSAFFGSPKEVEQWEDWEMFYSIPGSNFTSITVNWNTRFLGHMDAKNSDGALSCMACWGTYRGGELCFPRLDVAIAVGKRDMLVCDCPREMHGTLSPVQGTRYSIVVYTRQGLTKAGLKSKSVNAGM
jgi:hypothetical protein